jgi:hypothetical protein
MWVSIENLKSLKDFLYGGEFTVVNAITDMFISVSCGS